MSLSGQSGTVTHDISDRSLRTYLLAVARRPGARFQLLALAGFGVGVVVKSGFAVALAILVGCLVAGASYGFWRFRRTGRVY